MVIKKLSFIFLFLLSINGFSQDCILDKKPVQNLVQDYADVLTDSEEEGLRQSLIKFNDTTSTQILIITVTNLCGYDKASFTYEIGEKWGVGNAKFDNGIVIMVKPKELDGKGEAFIATGYGVEGVFPDAIAKRIVENEMIPYFKEKDYYNGIAAAAYTTMEITSGEYSADDYAKPNLKSFLPFVFVIIIFIIIIFFKVGKARRYATTNDMTFWAAWSLMNAAGRSHSGSWGNFSSGGGSFGGFGGGSFGGGGAGGSW